MPPDHLLERRLPHRLPQRWRKGAAAPSFAPLNDEADDVRRAADRVLAGWQLGDTDALSQEEFAEHLEWIVAAASAAGADTALGADIAGGDIVLRRNILDTLRRELVTSWASAEVKPDSTAMLEVLQRLEGVRARLEPGWQQDFATRLVGADGLDLVVEVAHDLRSPLTSVLFLSETIWRGQSGPVNDVQRRQMGLIYSAALGLISVVGDVIDLARDGDEITDADAAPFSLSELMQSVADIVQPMAEEKQLGLDVRSANTDQRIGHPIALSRVLLNLTTNALKFTREGSVEIVARELDVNRIEFAVRDTGSGIADEVKDSLFSAFRRRRGANKYYFSGTGLGLSIARRLVESMDSELKIETGGEGTRFSFVLHLPPAPKLQV